MNNIRIYTLFNQQVSTEIHTYLMTSSHPLSLSKVQKNGLKQEFILKRLGLMSERALKTSVY